MHRTTVYGTVKSPCFLLPLVLSGSPLATGIRLLRPSGSRSRGSVRGSRVRSSRPSPLCRPRNHLQLLPPRKLLHSKLCPQRRRSIPKSFRKYHSHWPPRPRILRPHRRPIMLLHSPLQIRRNPGIQRPISTLEDVEMIHASVTYTSSVSSTILLLVHVSASGGNRGMVESGRTYRSHHTKTVPPLLRRAEK